ncbi:MAG: DUF4129 domain-containing protein [Gammaproteobacteria bacterium]|nr:DUF4129 domain-containing protein [Gammaproteobacteria bacterium]
MNAVRVLLAGVVMFCGAVVSESTAADGIAAESKALVEEVLLGEDFNRETVTKVPKFLKDFFETDRDQGAEPELSFEWMRVVAALMEFALWTAAVVLVLWLLYRLRVWEYLPSSNAQAADRPKLVAGLEVAAETLPTDVAGESHRLWQAGSQREAVALLYRATIAILMDRYGCTFRESDTEEECLRKAERTVTAESTVEGQVIGYFRLVTGVWQRLAYAHEAPPAEAFEQAVADWRRAFDPAVVT